VSLTRTLGKPPCRRRRSPYDRISKGWQAIDGSTANTLPSDTWHPQLVCNCRVEAGSCRGVNRSWEEEDQSHCSASSIMEKRHEASVQDGVVVHVSRCMDNDPDMHERVPQPLSHGMHATSMSYPLLKALSGMTTKLYAIRSVERRLTLNGLSVERTMMLQKGTLISIC
jgi:hypothetical protein